MRLHFIEFKLKFIEYCLLMYKILNLLNRNFRKVVPGDGLEPSHSMSEGF